MLLIGFTFPVHSLVTKSTKQKQSWRNPFVLATINFNHYFLINLYMRHVKLMAQGLHDNSYQLAVTRGLVVQSLFSLWLIMAFLDNKSWELCANPSHILNTDCLASTLSYLGICLQNNRKLQDMNCKWLPLDNEHAITPTVKIPVQPRDKLPWLKFLQST
jgi:hypothetical protein